MSLSVVVFFPGIQPSLGSVPVEIKMNVFYNYTTYISCGLRVEEVIFVTLTRFLSI